MKESITNQLEYELRQAGAGKSEIAELTVLAGKLPRLKQYRHIRDESVSGKWRHIWSFRLLSGGAAAMTMIALLILLAQPALPTSWLFPVQKFSDRVAVAVRPSYRANVMMRRAQQVNALVAAHAPSDKVMATLNDYTAEANAYKATPHASYAAFEYCKSNLQQAAAVASPQVKQAITASLASLEAT